MSSCCDFTNSLATENESLFPPCAATVFGGCLCWSTYFFAQWSNGLGDANALELVVLIGSAGDWLKG